MKRETKRVGIMVVAALACVPALCFAQKQVNGDGHLLDNNLQVGSNKINPDQPPPNYQFRNDLVTGNITGLGYFHGRVGYSAPGELSIHLPSDDLFRFRAETWPETLIGVNPNIAAYAVPPVSIYGSAAPTTAGQVMNATSTSVLQPFNGTYQSTQVYAGAIAEQIQRSRTGLPNDMIGVVPQPSGQLLQINASPLLGVRVTPAGTIPGSPAALAAIKAAAQANATAADGTSAGSTNPGEAAVNADGTPATGGQTPAPTGANPADARIGSLSMVLGQYYQRTALMPGPLYQEARNTEVPVTRIRSQLLMPLVGYDSVKAQDPYLDLLTRLKQNKAGSPAAPEPSFGARAAIVRPPTPLELEKARLAADAAHRAALGLPPLAEGKKEPEESAAAAQRRKEHEEKVAGPLAKLFSELKDQGPPLKTLSGTRQDRATDMMREGESELATGRYLDAEAKYRAALAEDPDRPLAVVGLIHAQLGAGMIRSAAYNLRSLFEEHPELIATRYEARLMPAPQRLQWARHQLEEMIATTNREDPPLMLAYLGYQLGSTDLVRYGLDYAEARQPEDPLIALLRRLWLPDAGSASGASGASGSGGGVAK